MARQNPVLSAINSLGSNPYLQQSAAMFGAAGSSFAQGASLALKLDALLTNEEQRLQNNVMKSQQMLETAINNRVQQDLAQRKLEMQAAQYNNSNRQAKFNDQLNLLKTQNDMQYKNSLLKFRADEADAKKYKYEKDLLRDKADVIAKRDNILKSIRDSHTTNDIYGNVVFDENAYNNDPRMESVNVLNSLLAGYGVGAVSTTKQQPAANNTNAQQPEIFDTLTEGGLSANQPIAEEPAAQPTLGGINQYSNKYIDQYTIKPAESPFPKQPKQTADIVGPTNTAAAAARGITPDTHPMLANAANNNVTVKAKDPNRLEYAVQATARDMFGNSNLPEDAKLQMLSNMHNLIDYDKLNSIVYSKNIKPFSYRYYEKIIKPNQLLKALTVMSTDAGKKDVVSKLGAKLLSSPGLLKENRLWEINAQNELFDIVGRDKKNVERFIDTYDRAYSKAKNSLGYDPNSNMPEMTQAAKDFLKKRVLVSSGDITLANARNVTDAAAWIARENSMLGDYARAALNLIPGFDPNSVDMLAGGELISEDENVLIQRVQDEYQKAYRDKDYVLAHGIELIAKSPKDIYNRETLVGTKIEDKYMEAPNRMFSGENAKNIYKELGLNFPKKYGSPGVKGVDPFKHSINPRYKEALSDNIPQLFELATDPASPINKIMNAAASQVAANSTARRKSKTVTVDYNGKKYKFKTKDVEDYAVLMATIKLSESLKATENTDTRIP